MINTLNFHLTEVGGARSSGFTSDPPTEFGGGWVTDPAGVASTVAPGRWVSALEERGISPEQSVSFWARGEVPWGSLEELQAELQRVLRERDEALGLMARERDEALKALRTRQ